MNVTGTVRQQVTFTGTKTFDGRDASDPINNTIQASYANGTGANQVNQTWQDYRTLASAAAETLNLAGAALIDAFGDTITFTKIKTIQIYNTSTTDTLYVGHAAADEWLGFLETSGDRLKLPPGACITIDVPTANGMAVAASAKLKFEHSATTTNSLTYRLTIGGTV